MSSPMQNLKTFMQRNVLKVKQLEISSTSFKGTTFVIGNEAGDADSIISSLTYAYLKHFLSLHDEGQPKIARLRMPVIPIISVRRDEAHLRRDVELLLAEVDLQLSDLICLDECHISRLASDNKLDLILVDHNVLSSSVSAKLGEKEHSDDMIKEILDHHEDGCCHLSASVREIAFDSEKMKPGVASTCTIVAEKFLEPQNIEALTSDIATLLIAVIALDSLNMDPMIKRGTPRDKHALDSLQLMFPKIERDRLFGMLTNAKTDPIFWEALSARDAVRIDRKDFAFKKETDFGVTDAKGDGLYAISSVLQSASSFLRKSDLDKVLQNTFYCTKREAADCNEESPSSTVPADLLVIMGLELFPSIRRSLLFFSPSEKRLRNLSTYLAINCTDMKLSTLVTEPDYPASRSLDGGDVHMLAFDQGNTDLSRKQIAPIVSKFYETPYNK